MDINNITINGTKTSLKDINKIATFKSSKIPNTKNTLSVRDFFIS